VITRSAIRPPTIIGRRLLAVAIGMSLATAGVASADIAGTVTTLGGIPLGGSQVVMTDATGAAVATILADPTGRYTVATAALAGKTAPFTVRAGASDPCRVAPELTARSAQAVGVADGVTQNLGLDVIELCATGAPAGFPAPTAFVDSSARRVLAGPGATAYLRTPIPAEATGVEVRLSNGAVVSQPSPAAGIIPIVGPTAAYNGPLTLAFSLSGTPVTRPLGELVSGIVPEPAAASSIDVVAAVPLGGVAFRGTGSDAEDWISLLAWLSRPSDAFGAFGFDSFARPVTDIAPLSGSAGVRLVEAIAKATLSNTGGFDEPNVAFAQARRLLTAPGIDPKRRKLVVYLSTGAPAQQPYQNGHVLLGYNGSGQPWPVCVVQVGLGLPTVGLRRIALDTGGSFAEVGAARDVPDAILQCRATASGDATLLESAVALRRRARNVRVAVPARRNITVLLAAGSLGKAGLSLIDPSGRTRTLAKPGPGATFVQKESYTLVKVARPRRGQWTVRVSARQNVGARLRVMQARAVPAS
jgi:hypothetical protein